MEDLLSSETCEADTRGPTTENSSRSFKEYLITSQPVQLEETGTDQLEENIPVEFGQNGLSQEMEVVVVVKIESSDDLEERDEVVKLESSDSEEIFEEITIEYDQTEQIHFIKREDTIDIIDIAEDDTTDTINIAEDTINTINIAKDTIDTINIAEEDTIDTINIAEDTINFAEEITIDKRNFAEIDTIHFSEEPKLEEITIEYIIEYDEKEQIEFMKQDGDTIDSARSKYGPQNFDLGSQRIQQTGRNDEEYYSSRDLKNTNDLVVQNRDELFVHKGETSRSHSRYGLRLKPTRPSLEHLEIPITKPYKCRSCDKSFATQSYLQKHEETHSDGSCLDRSDKFDGSCSCNFCQEFAFKHCHEVTKPHKCRICNKAFGNRDDLIAHTNAVHIGLKLYECVYCQEAFSLESSLNVHVKNYHRYPENYDQLHNIPHKCRICYKTFYYKASLDDHMTSEHRDKRSYVCSTCDEVFSSKSKLNKHVKYEHNTEKSRIYECSICYYSCLLRCRFKEHMQTHAPDAEKLHRCIICKNKAYSSRSALKNHVKTYHDSFRYKCNICKVAFSYEITLKEHIQFIHSSMSEAEMMDVHPHLLVTPLQCLPVPGGFYT